MATGTIKKLVRERGFGFIQGSDGVETFFHRSALSGEGFDTLTEGQAVEFDIERGAKTRRRTGNETKGQSRNCDGGLIM